jgi:thiamine biosynthesis lipoprotein
MGTTFAVTVVGPSLSEERAALLRHAINETLADVDRQMSTYDASSEVSRFNRADKGAPFPVSADTFRVVQEAVAFSELTAGAFDVTVGPLVTAWGFGPTGRPDAFPTAEELEALLDRVGYTGLVLDETESTITKLQEGLEIDLSALAKGYGVDRVAELLDADGFVDYLIEVGGEVRTRGHGANNGSWRVGIERPTDGPSSIQHVVELTDAALATSGDYRNFFELDGRRLSHTIDPRTGRPVEHRLASASVVDATCMRADAMATALAVLGPEDGFELALAQGWAVLLIIREDDGSFTERATPGFLTLVAEPRS